MLRIRPISMSKANLYVEKLHRHNGAMRCRQFALACYDDQKLVGVALCGNPTARRLDDGLTLEINRVCTDGTYNACSKLYGACVKVAKDMGYERVITYTLESEGGASLKASNFNFDGNGYGAKRNTSAREKERARKRNDGLLFPLELKRPPQELKQRWSITFKQKVKEEKK